MFSTTKVMTLLLTSLLIFLAIEWRAIHMRKDPTEFRKRFAAWQRGVSPYEAGLKKYADGKQGYVRQNGNDIAFDENTGELLDQVTGERGTMMLPEITVTGRDFTNPFNNLSAYNPDDIVKGFNALTLGGLNNLSPALWARRLYDLLNGELTIDSWLNGNAGVVPTKFALEHPGYAAAANTLFDFWTIGGPSLIRNAGKWASLANDVATTGIRLPRLYFSFLMPEDASTATEMKNIGIHRYLDPVKRTRSMFEGVPEADYNGDIPQASMTFGSTDRPWRRLTPAGRRFGFADPHADILTPSAGQETASPELASTLYPRSKYTLQDVPSKLITTYDEIPDRRTGNTALSAVNTLYDAYSKALSGYLKYGINPPLPYIVSVGDDAVKVGFENAFYNMAYMPASVQHTIEMPKGVTNKLALLMLEDYPEQQLYLIQSWPERYKSAARLLGIPVLIGVAPPMRQLGTDIDVDDLFDQFIYDHNSLDANHAMPLAANQETRDVVDNVRGLIQDRDIFKSNIWSYVPSYNLSDRYARIISNAEDPGKYITDNFAKLILRGAKDNYFKLIKKIKQKDYARRIKAVERLNENDARFEIADDNRESFNNALESFGKSYNAAQEDASKLTNTVNTVALWMQDQAKEWNLVNQSPNRPGWMLKSLMEGNALEKQLSKDGSIAVANIQNHIKKGSDIEKTVVDKVLNTKFAGLQKINYADFKHAVQDELISYRHEPDSGYESYGMDRIGRHRSWDNDLAVETYTFTSPRLPFGNAKHYYGNTLGHSRTFTDTLNEPDVLYVMESLSDWALNYEENSWIDQNRYDNLVKNIKYLEDELSKLSPQERSRDASRQDGMTASLRKMKENIQGAKSAIDRAPHERYLTTNFERRQIQENLLNAARHGLSKMRYPTRDTAAAIEGYRPEGGSYWDGSVRAERGDTPYTDYITDLEHLLRGLEALEPVAGNLYATLEWLKSIDKVKKNIERVKKIEERFKAGETTYNPKHETILDKYLAFPKIFKKLYRDLDVRIVTDSKGFTWYEVDVPKNLKRKEWMYGIGTAVTAGSTLKPRKKKNKITE